jgi:hypothetical protein
VKSRLKLYSASLLTIDIFLMNAYQPTSEDVWNVLSSNPLQIILEESLERLSERLIADLDFQLIEEAALYGDDLDEQTNYANDEIARQLRVAGVLAPLPPAGETLTKEQRLNQANAFIAAVASCGRQFFRRQNGVSSFLFTDANKLVFVDAHTKIMVDVLQPPVKWKGFSNGGTLVDVVGSLARYINVEESAELNLGPWRENLDLWGYGEDMAIVRAAAKANGLTNACAESEVQIAPLTDMEAPKG